MKISTYIVTIREKLLALKAGMRILKDGKVYEVIAVVYRDANLPKCRTDVRLLEEGAIRFEQVPGRFLAAGKVITLDHSIYCTWYAEKSSDFEIL